VILNDNRLAKHRQPGRRRLWVPAAVLAVTSFAGAAVALTEGTSAGIERPAGTQPTVMEGPSAPAAAALTAAPPEKKTPKKTTRKTREPLPAAPVPAAGIPQRVYIESLGIDAPVLRIVTAGSTLTPPPDPQDLGWWAGGAQPGAARGSALITGHTVHDGGGALDDLETLRPGAEIGVQTVDGLIRYVAESVDVLDKDTIAQRAPQLFSQGVEGRLVLVTCEDWDGTGYRSNVVVTAVPIA
jgi:sortase (surface protein transpeptidase)